MVIGSESETVEFKLTTGGYNLVYFLGKSKKIHESKSPMSKKRLRRSAFPEKFLRLFLIGLPYPNPDSNT